MRYRGGGEVELDVHGEQVGAEHLDAERAAARLRVLLDGLRLQLVTAPRHTSAEWAMAVLDDYLTALGREDGLGLRGPRARSG